MHFDRSDSEYNGWEFYALEPHEEQELEAAAAKGFIESLYIYKNSKFLKSLGSLEFCQERYESCDDMTIFDYSHDGEEFCYDDEKPSDYADDHIQAILKSNLLRAAAETLVPLNPEENEDAYCSPRRPTHELFVSCFSVKDHKLYFDAKRYDTTCSMADALEHIRVVVTGYDALEVFAIKHLERLRNAA